MCAFRAEARLEVGVEYSFSPPQCHAGQLCSVFFTTPVQVTGAGGGSGPLSSSALVPALLPCYSSLESPALLASRQNSNRLGLAAQSYCFHCNK